MTLLLTQIFLCLLAALLIGVIVTWLLRRNIALRREQMIQQEWQSRFSQTELDRDRTVQNLTAEIERLKTRAPAEKNVVLADYENLVAKLEGQVGEREDAIGNLRSEIQTLRGRLTEAESTANQRETALLEQHRSECERLQAQLQQKNDQRSGEQASTVRHQQEISRLEKELEQREAVDWTERENALRQEHQQEIARLEKEPEQREAVDWTERENALRQEHQQEIARLEKELEQREAVDWTERENALRQEHQQEIVRLNAELELQQKRASAGSDVERIDGLNAAIRMRDDAIAVLRNDLAELNQERVEHSGVQDEQLRVAMDEAIAWQEKYETVLAGIQSQPDKIDDAHLYKEPPPVSSAKQRERTVGDRIGSVLSHPGGPKDRLREIKGIGPVLERRLHDVGIYHFKQIAEFDADDIARLSNELGRHASRITRDDWVTQAQSLNKKYHG